MLLRYDYIRIELSCHDSEFLIDVHFFVLLVYDVLDLLEFGTVNGWKGHICCLLQLLLILLIKLSLFLVFFVDLRNHHVWSILFTASWQIKPYIFTKCCGFAFRTLADSSQEFSLIHWYLVIRRRMLLIITVLFSCFDRLYRAGYCSSNVDCLCWIRKRVFQFLRSFRSTSEILFFNIWLLLGLTNDNLRLLFLLINKLIDFIRLCFVFCYFLLIRLFIFY